MPPITTEIHAPELRSKLLGLCRRLRACLGRLLRVALLSSGLAFSCALAEGLGITDSLLDWVGARYGEAARQRVAALRTLMDRAEAAAEPDKLARVNDFFNSVPYDSDQSLWRQEDYWATPIEMLGIEGADCEDYAIAKYFTLRELGVPADRLRITYVKALTLNQAHMVLAYYETPDAEPVILDNLSDRIALAGERDDLVPVYSFNGEGLWLAVSRSQGEKVGQASRIKNWSNLRQKLAKELNR